MSGRSRRKWVEAPEGSITVEPTAITEESPTTSVDVPVKQKTPTKTTIPKEDLQRLLESAPELPLDYTTRFMEESFRPQLTRFIQNLRDLAK